MARNGVDDIRPHAVVFPFPALGHIIPMMHLSCRLESLGLFITFVNTERNHLRILQSWRNRRMPLPQEQGIHVNMVGLPDEAMPSLDSISVFEAFMATNRLKGAFDELVGKLMKSQTCPPVCIIADGFMSWTQDVAQKFRLPWAVFWASSVATCLISSYIPDLIQKGFAPLRAENEHRSISFISGMPTLSATDLPTSITKEDGFDPGFRHRIERIQRVKRADWILANTFTELEPHEIQAMKAQVQRKLLPVGPMLSLEFLEVNDGTVDLEVSTDDYVEDDRCMEWLDKQAPLSTLYVSYGNIAHLSAMQLEQIALGLEACSLPFLWVIQTDLMNTIPADVRKGFMDRVKSRGLVVSSAPFLRVIRHHAIGAFLTHCGWNSTLEGISVGLPMLCWPCFSDQMLNCRYIVREWRIGLEFEKSKGSLVTKEEIERVVRVLMESDEGRQIRRRIRFLKDSARHAALEDGASRKNLKEFAEAMKQEMSASFFF